MARKIQRLSALAVGRLSKPGLYADGAGLYLRVGRNGSKSWAFRYTLSGKAREMGFGSLHAVSLADARKKANDARLLLSDRQDPLTERHLAETQNVASEKLAAALAMTFDQCAEAYIGAHEAAWKNEKHRQQWRHTLATYVSPAFGSVPVQKVDTDNVVQVVEPIWSKKTETARRVRGRIEVILDWAKVRGFRSGENPARWRGHLSHLLPACTKVRSVKHHAALPYDAMPAFMIDLRRIAGSSSAALEFLILTAARTSEAIYARWSEVNLDRKTWVVPAERMKGQREHRVPLSGPAIALLKRTKKQNSPYLFPGPTLDEPLSNMALLMALGRMEWRNVTSHGFRSTFRDWAAEKTEFPSEVVEMALAHSVGNKTVAAYRRTDLFDKRRRLMSEWAVFCGSGRN